MSEPDEGSTRRRVLVLEELFGRDLDGLEWDDGLLPSPDTRLQMLALAHREVAKWERPQQVTVAVLAQIAEQENHEAQLDPYEAGYADAMGQSLWGRIRRR